VIDHAHGMGAIAFGVVNVPSDLAAAFDAGVDVVGTNPFASTASDITFLRWLVHHSAMPVFAGSPAPTLEDARQAIEAGAAFLLAGESIIDPGAIAARYVSAMATPRRS
jgi:putative N-acetylmannosamine-6-phosphate epimerase